MAYEDDEPTNLSRRRVRSNPPGGYVQSASALRSIYGTRKIGAGPAEFSDRDTTPSARAILPGSNPAGGMTDSDTWDRFFNKRAFAPGNSMNASGLARTATPTARTTPQPDMSASGYLDRILNSAPLPESSFAPAAPKPITREVEGGGTIDEYRMEDGGIIRSLKSKYGYGGSFTPAQPNSIASRLRRNNLGYSPLT